jgi:hypothetical protein
LEKINRGKQHLDVQIRNRRETDWLNQRTVKAQQIKEGSDLLCMLSLQLVDASYETSSLSLLLLLLLLLLLIGCAARARLWCAVEPKLFQVLLGHQIPAAPGQREGACL